MSNFYSITACIPHIGCRNKKTEAAEGVAAYLYPCRDRPND